MASSSRGKKTSVKQERSLIFLLFLTDSSEFLIRREWGSGLRLAEMERKRINHPDPSRYTFLFVVFKFYQSFCQIEKMTNRNPILTETQ